MKTIKLSNISLHENLQQLNYLISLYMRTYMVFNAICKAECFIFLKKNRKSLIYMYKKDPLAM